jgi:hypothetical protein
MATILLPTPASARTTGRILLCASALLAGCRTAPDVAPFVDATTALHVVVASVGPGIAAGVADEDQRSRFARAWAARTAATQAMADYGSGLAEVVAAGRSGGESATRVLGQARTLLATVGVAFPGTDAATEAVGRVAATLYQRLAEARAADTVAEAIEQSDPAIRELAAVLAQDLATIARLVDDLRQNARTALLAAAGAREPGGLRLLRSLEDEAASARAAAARAGDAAQRQAQLEKATQLEALRQQEQGASWHVEMTAALEAADARFRAQLATIRAAAAATQAWGGAHEQLLRAARSGNTPNFAVLVQFTRDLLDAYEELQRQ